MINKKQIRNCFNNSHLSYDDAARIQKNCAEELLSLLENELPSFYPKTFLDLGTGTGTMSILLKKKFPFSKITLNDISPNMINLAHKNMGDSNTQLLQGDMETIDFGHHDLIISNFAMQWVNDLKTTLEKSYHQSNVLAFTCLLDGTFKEWSAIFDAISIPTPVPLYPHKEDLITFLLSMNPKKYKFTTSKFKLEFSNTREFIHYLKHIGASYSSVDVKIGDLKKILEYNTGKFTVTYEVFFAILSKN